MIGYGDTRLWTDHTVGKGYTCACALMCLPWSLIVHVPPWSNTIVMSSADLYSIPMLVVCTSEQVWEPLVMYYLWYIMADHGITSHLHKHLEHDNKKRACKTTCLSFLGDRDKGVLNSSRKYIEKFSGQIYQMIILNSKTSLLTLKF
jgi:hypothetical protein